MTRLTCPLDPVSVLIQYQAQFLRLIHMKVDILALRDKPCVDEQLLAIAHVDRRGLGRKRGL